MEEVLSFYEQLEDKVYEQGREERKVMQKNFLKSLRNFKPEGRLLDIGAGSGILVEEALKMGYQAEGWSLHAIFKCLPKVITFL